MATAFDLSKFADAGPLARHRAIKAGIPANAVPRFAREAGLTYDEVARVVGSRRTLDRRIKSDGCLTVPEADRFARLATLYRTLVGILRNPEDVRYWLTRPKARLGDQTPLELMRTGTGTAAVETLILQARHGMLA